MKLKVSIIVASTILICFFRWRKKEKNALRRKVKNWVKDGYVLLNGVSGKSKSKLWKDISDRLIIFWSNISEGFEISDPLTWPPRADRKKYTFTEMNILSRSTKIFTNNYQVQALICSLYDPNLTRVHFGYQTHWQLRLLINPFWGLFPFWVPSDSINLFGTDEAWHMPLWPTFDDSLKPEDYISAHIDAGFAFHYSKGIPCAPDSSLMRNCTLEERMLSMVAWQTAIIFYCDTPGTLGPTQRATGFYPGSHFSLLDSIRRKISISSTTPMPGNGCMESYSGQGFCPSHSAIQSQLTIPYNIFQEAVKKWGLEVKPIQLTIPEDKLLLSLGHVTHSAMIASETMNGYPRVIQNVKVHAMTPYRISIEDFISKIPKESLIYQLYTDPMKTAAMLYEDSDPEAIMRIQSRSDRLFELLQC